MSACSAHDDKKRIVWFYRSNPNSFFDKGNEEWKCYSDFETEYIEEAFQRNEECVDVNDHVIDLKSKRQFQKDKENSSKPIKRELIDRKNYVRNERFSSNTERATPKTFVPGREWGRAPSLDKWRYKNETIRGNSSAVAEMAAQGILIEGKLQNKQFDAQRMAEQLRSCGTSEEDILKCAVRLYSASSFLFALINDSLRSEDVSKADTLGPIVWLLNLHMSKNGVISGEEFVVYRGATLKEEMIDEYSKAIGQHIVWTGFTSTSRNRAVAEMFSGNTLFIIRIMESSFARRRDISSISRYSDEEEVLLTANFVFRLENVQRDGTADHRKYFISMVGSGF